MSMRPPESGRHPRVLVVRRRYVGDTVLVEPLVRNLRAHWPAAWITVALDSPYVDVLAGSPHVDEVVDIPVGRPPGAPRVGGWVQLVRRIAARPYDVAIDLAHNEISQATVLLSRAPRRLALELLPSRVRRRWVYTDIKSVGEHEVLRTHAVDLNNSLLEVLGVPSPARIPVLEVPADLKLDASGIIARHWNEIGRPSGPTLLVHPGSGAPARRWPPADFAFVADMAARQLEAHVLILDGPSERGLAEEVRAAMVEPASVVRLPMSVPFLLGLLTQVDLLLCNDSGPMHLAAAVGTPVCALYGGQSRVTWAPLGSPDHRTFQAEIPCGDACIAPSDCSPTDPMNSFCVRRIDREAVAAAVYARLEGHPPRRGLSPVEPRSATDSPR